MHTLQWWTLEKHWNHISMSPQCRQLECRPLSLHWNVISILRFQSDWQGKFQSDCNGDWIGTFKCRRLGLHWNRISMPRIGIRFQCTQYNADSISFQCRHSNAGNCVYIRIALALPHCNFILIFPMQCRFNQFPMLALQCRQLGLHWNHIGMPHIGIRFQCTHCNADSISFQCPHSNAGD